MYHPLKLVRFFAASAVLVAVIAAASVPVAGYLSFSDFVDPTSGLYASAAAAAPSSTSRPDVSGMLGDEVVVRFDARGVPHIFAGSESEAALALGYVVASHRLFQMEYLSRLASGRLSEILGPEAVEADVYLRGTGMADGARVNLGRILESGSVEGDLLEAYAAGVNARIGELRTSALPLEYRLLGIEPDAWSPINSLHIQQLMAFDLSYSGPNAAFIDVVGRYGRATYDSLFPAVAPYQKPIVGGVGVAAAPGERREAERSHSHRLARLASASAPASSAASAAAPERRHPVDLVGAGFVPGTGSNNWVLSGSATESGRPMLAGDMHLGLTLPAIWYEAHIVTPESDVYGVTIPGAPVVVAGMTRGVAWSFTNTGSDQIDHYLLAVDSTGSRYRFEGEWLEFDRRPDTILVRDGEDVAIDRLFSRFGPVTESAGAPIAVQWVGHRPSRTILALREMNRATSAAEFEAALLHWDIPMQNIAYADTSGAIGLQTTGYLPVRRGADGCGLLDGTSADGDWIGRVPFDDLPSADPAVGWATSTNQLPEARTDIYLGCGWDQVFRSVRIDELLSGKSRHGVDDMMSYQSDVRSVQADLFVPLLADLELPSEARASAASLVDWDRRMSIDSREAVLFATWIEALEKLVWDEPGFARRPHLSVLHDLIISEPTSRWFDLVATAGRETADDLLLQSFSEAASQARPALWGDIHKLSIRHVSRLTQLAPFWRGPFAFGGYDETLSPGEGRTVTHSASWRFVVDFATDPPTAFGTYPGGQSGDPLSELYDDGLDTYLRFDYNALLRPRTPDGVSGRSLTLRPGGS